MELAQEAQAILGAWHGWQVLRHDFVQRLWKPAIGSVELLASRNQPCGVRHGDAVLRESLARTNANVTAGIVIRTTANLQPGRWVAFFRTLTTNQIGQIKNEA